MQKKKVMIRWNGGMRQAMVKKINAFPCGKHFVKR